MSYCQSCNGYEREIAGLRSEVEALRARVVELEGAGAHEWTKHERDGWTVCSRCGMVRNYDRETPCRGTTPPVAPRTERRELGELAKELDAAATNLAEQSVRYRHRRTGGTYVLTSVSLRESDLAMLVSYVPTECRGVTFTRPLVEFQEKFEAESFESLRAEVEALKTRVAELEESASMACECPPSGCDCAGCRYANEKYGAKR